MELNQALSGRVAELLRSAGATIAIAESTTGGLISAALLAIPGASAYHRGGAIIYTRQSRVALLGVDAETVAGLEPMTTDMALVFARAVRKTLDADWGVAELGIAGPGGSVYGIDPGNVVIAVSGTTERAVTFTTGVADRRYNMQAFGNRTLGLVVEALADS